ncbi:MAG: NAD-dependent epimerase/dehydratase family protein [Segetibacter sp.]
MINNVYKNDLTLALSGVNDFDLLKDKKILITGATGLICSYLVDLIMYSNQYCGSNVQVYAMGRNEAFAKERFEDYRNLDNFVFIKQDVTDSFNFDYKFNYIIHGAGNATPNSITTDPVGTMNANYFGVYNVLEYSRKYSVEKILYISSSEVYGQGNERGIFKEDYSGYVNSLELRSCYPSSKRASETLCVSYNKQYGLHAVIARPAFIYGPTFNITDNRVVPQFLNNVLNGNDIIMKSEGQQMRSYCYVGDCATAILKILFHGNAGEAYNIANKNSNVNIRKVADVIANLENKKVIFELPDNKERASYSAVTNSILDTTKLEDLGWKGQYSIEKGLQQTLEILKSYRVRNNVN